MDLDRMELADCGTPEALVAAILKQMPDMPIAVPIEDIAYALGIVDIRDIDGDGFEGGLIAFADRSEGTILVKRGNRQRRRFTIGHELGHFLNPWHRPKTDEGFRCTSADLRSFTAKPGDRAVQMEVEANRFAASLLFPEPFFGKDMAARRSVDVGHILELARRYDMSKEATARRYVQAHQEPCAVVVSRDGVFFRSYRHASFPFVDVSASQPLPSGSATARVAIGEGQVSDWIEVDSGIWLGSGRPRRKICEQILGQQSGFRLTMLTLDEDGEKEDDDEDNEDRLEESWTPRFHK